jgi:hypothetical protein
MPYEYTFATINNAGICHDGSRVINEFTEPKTATLLMLEFTTVLHE